MAAKKTASSARASEVHEKATDKLDAKEFLERRKNHQSSRRNNSTRGSGSLADVVQGVSSIHPDSTRLHSSQHRPGADGMQHHKHHVRTLALPSIGDGAARFDKGRGDGTRGGPGCMGGVFGAPGEAFLSKLSLVIPGRFALRLLSGLRGHLVDWVEKASFACLSKLFEIDAKERQCKTLLTARNLMAVVREPQDYVINILPRKMPPSAPRGSREEKNRTHHPGGSRTKTRRRLSSKENSSKKEEAGEEAWEGREGAHSSQEVPPPPPPPPPPPRPITHEADVIIEEPVNAAPHSISSGPDTSRG
ncbi:hypothetical protein CK203_082753 [Vitis vinifera]|uniref:Uncharacterized protein n=1 Tax=Vitis vinifera TaxID=29760 RepID=A0A438F9Z9_VITVI|nr:hypothetical protein CK203_082753 [Vitis vinifera]